MGDSSRRPSTASSSIDPPPLPVATRPDTSVNCIAPIYTALHRDVKRLLRGWSARLVDLLDRTVRRQVDEPAAELAADVDADVDRFGRRRILRRFDVDPGVGDVLALDRQRLGSAPQ